jgi:hypothetical protein
LVFSVGLQAGPLKGQAENLAEQRAAAQTFLANLAAQPPAQSGIYSEACARRWSLMTPPRLGKADFVRAARSPYAKEATLGAMGFIAALGAAAAGTSMNAFQASFLAVYAAALKGNPDPDLAQAGSLLAQESAALTRGDSGGAQAAALGFAAFQDNGALAGTCGPQEAVFVDSLRTICSYDWGSMLLALGRAVLACVMGFIEGGVYGAVVGLVVSLVTSALNGDFTRQTSRVVGGQGAGEGDSSGWSGQSGGLSAGETSFGPGQGFGSGFAASRLSAPTGAENTKVSPGNGSAKGGVLVGSPLGAGASAP